MARRLRQMHRLTPWWVKAVVPRGAVGAYTLYSYIDGQCRPVYTGRSDTDLRRRLLVHARLGRGTYFEYDVQRTIERAFVLECAAYHVLEGVTANRIHPASPAGTGHLCPFCWATVVAARQGCARLNSPTSRSGIE